MLQIGISETNITPAPGLLRAGMPYPQAGQDTAWPLMGRAIIFDDSSRLVALITLDLLFLTTQTVAEFRQAIAARTSLAPTDVMIACTHTHWAPHTTAIMDVDADFAYLDFVQARVVEAVARALATRRPVRLRVGQINAPGWAFNRRPIYRTPLGEQVGTQGPHWIPEFVRMEGPDDPALSVALFEDVNGKTLGGLVNFTCHTTVGPDEPMYSSDYPGPLTERLAQHFGGVFGFLQGCAGNIWPGDMRQPRPRHVEAGSQHTHTMGLALAEKAIEALADGQTIIPTQVQLVREVLQIPQRRPTPEQVQQARWFLEQRPPDVDLRDHHLKMYGHEYTFFHDWSNVWQSDTRQWLFWQEDWFARGTLGLWEWQRRAGSREIVENVEVQVLVVGDGSTDNSLALVGYPAEYFVEYGLQTKAASPFAFTMVSELTNGWHGYVPTPQAFQHGGYEPRLGDASRLVPEAGDLICTAGVQLLQQIRNTR